MGTYESDIKGNILIVDDIAASLHLLATLLRKEQYNVRPVPNGKLALSGATAIPPDLILLDIKMPEMDGYYVFERLKKNEKTQDIPVIFISALDETFNKVKAFSVGAVDYITKPFRTEEVLAKVQAHLDSKRNKEKLQKSYKIIKDNRNI